MKESHRKGVATILTPSHARAVVRLHLKRWTGVSVGWVLSSEKVDSGKPTASDCQEGHNVSHDNASAARPCGVEDPMHAEKLHAREPGGPVVAREQ